MPRPSRLLALTTAIALSFTAVPGTASAQPATAGSESAASSAASSATSLRAARSADLTAGHQRVAPSSTTSLSVPLGAGASARTLAPAPERKRTKRWPVRLRGAVATAHYGTPSGEAQFQIASAQIRIDRGTNNLYVDAALRATPTTPVYLVAGFGRVQNGFCASPAGANLKLRTTDYANGNRIRVFGARPQATALGWNCVIAVTLQTETSYYDVVQAARINNVRQKPSFGVVVRRASLTSARYKKVRYSISNSRQTIATAPNVRLKVKTRGPVAVRYKKKLGSLKPGQRKNRSIQVRLTGRGNGKIIYIFSSRDYKVRLVTKVRSR
ncbi:hypothetical protein ABFT23_06330 [Nocardioides sp. C4-1]|uniref:hypothetical protein n=1 Tax=Nocardioides sp. C4-1 TaxID=3151851 RepID=UPI003267FD01